MTDYPECEKMARVQDQSQIAGEFLEWVRGKYSLCVYRGERFGGTYWPVNIDTQKLLAEFFEIDLGKVEEEKREMLEASRKEQDNVVPLEKPQDWYFTFGHGHANAGRYCVIHGTCMDAHKEMFRRYGDQWSMQYKSAEEAGVEKWKLKELK